VPYDPLTAEQQEVRELARSLAHDQIAPRAAEIDETAEFPWDIVELFRSHGLFALVAAEADGGAGVNALTTFVAIEEISKVCASSGLILALQELGALALRLGGNDAQRRRFLPRLASGEALAAYALTEAASGSDASALRTVARREGDHYVLDGAKRLISNVGVAGLTICFAKTDPDAGHRGISAFVIESGSSGLQPGDPEPKMGLRGSTTGDLFLDGCVVPVANRLGGEGEGFALAMAILDRSRPGIAAQALGLAQGATDYALAYARTRETMGKPIASHQLIAGTLAEMESACAAARALLYSCAARIDAGVEGPELSKYSAMCKLVCSDTAMEVTTKAVQVLGGYGYMRAHPVERMMRDAKATQIYEGTNEIQRLVIARELLRAAAAGESV